MAHPCPWLATLKEDSSHAKRGGVGANRHVQPGRRKNQPHRLYRSLQTSGTSRVSMTCARHKQQSSELFHHMRRKKHRTVPRRFAAWFWLEKHCYHSKLLHNLQKLERSRCVHKTSQKFAPEENFNGRPQSSTSRLGSKLRSEMCSCGTTSTTSTICSPVGGAITDPPTVRSPLRSEMRFGGLSRDLLKHLFHDLPHQELDDLLMVVKGLVAAVWRPAWGGEIPSSPPPKSSTSSDTLQKPTLVIVSTQTFGRTPTVWMDRQLLLLPCMPSMCGAPPDPGLYNLTAPEMRS